MTVWEVVELAFVLLGFALVVSAIGGWLLAAWEAWVDRRRLKRWPDLDEALQPAALRRAIVVVCEECGCELSLSGGEWSCPNLASCERARVEFDVQANRRAVEWLRHVIDGSPDD